MDKFAGHVKALDNYTWIIRIRDNASGQWCQLGMRYTDYDAAIARLDQFMARNNTTGD